MFGNQKHGLNLVNCALRWSPEPVNISEDFRYDHSVVSIFYATKMISLLVLCIWRSFGLNPSKVFSCYGKHCQSLLLQTRFATLYQDISIVWEPPNLVFFKAGIQMTLAPSVLLSALSRLNFVPFLLYILHALCGSCIASIGIDYMYRRRLYQISWSLTWYVWLNQSYSLRYHCKGLAPQYQPKPCYLLLPYLHCYRYQSSQHSHWHVQYQVYW